MIIFSIAHIINGLGRIKETSKSRLNQQGANTGLNFPEVDSYFYFVIHS